MKKLLFFLFGLLVVIFAIPVQRGAAETPDPTPVPDALVAEALAAKQASYPAWVGDEGKYLQASENSVPVENVVPNVPETANEWTGIVMQKYTNGSWEIFKANGYNPYSYPLTKTQLTFTAGSDIYPHYNRGATKIVFVTYRDGNYEIYTMDPNGGSLARLTTDENVDSQPQWSADGSKVVFVSDRDGNAEIYVMNADGSGQVRLTNYPNQDVYPTLSPDGSQIAWLQATDYGAAVWMMNADGTNQHPISPWFAYAQHLVWSPDGAWLAWDGDFTGDGWNEIALIRPDGTGLQQVSASGGYLYDIVMSSWMMNSQEILQNGLHYFVYDNQVYYSQTALSILGFTGEMLYVIDTSGTYDISLNYDAQGLDIQSPASQVLPLAQYSRASGFTVSWDGDDQGLSGFWKMDIQSKIGSNGDWAEWKPFVQPGSASFTGEPGTTVYFRSQATDHAENLESWPDGNGDTFTKLYRWLLQGQVFDNRETSISSPNIVVSPQPLNSENIGFDGSFIRYNVVTTTTVSVNQVGYENPPDTILLGDADLDYFWALSPSDNQIQNGTFETGDLSSWEIGGAMHVAWDEDVYHTGSSSGRVGRNFLSEHGLNLSNTSDGSILPQIVKTSDGVLHAVWSDATPINGNQTPDSDIFYSFKAPDSEWSPPIIVAPVHLYNAVYPQLVAGSDGTLHVVWLNASYGGSNISYASKSTGEEWSEGEVVGELPSYSYFESRAPQIALDGLGGVHVTWSDGNGLHYVNKPVNEAWLPSSLLGNYGEIPHGVKVASNDIVYVIYIFDGALREIHKSLDGNWTSEESIFPNVENFMVTSNAAGGLSVLWKQQNKIYLANSDEDISWSNPVLVSSQGLPIELRAFEISDTGEILISWLAVENSEYHAYFRMRYLNGTWSAIVPLIKDFNNTSGVDFLSETDGSFHLVWSGASSFDTNNTLTSEIYYEKIYWAQSEQATLSQIVSIPSTMNKPTLSFSYMLNVLPSVGEDTEFDVLINDQSVYSTTTETSNWSHIWLDLSPWISETITVTFQVTSYSTEGFAYAYLDDITVSSWLTPVPLAVDLPHLPPFNAPTQITITGENFLEGATVRLNDTPLQNIQWLDEHTLQATIPANLPPGRYHLWVTNPGGQASVLAYAVSAGNIIFIPVLRR